MAQRKTKRRWPPAILAGLLAALTLSFPAGAQVAWDGSTSTNWFDGTNWTPGVAPTSSLSATIDITTNAPVINAAGAAASNLFIGGTGGTTGSLTVTGAGRLSVAGSGSGSGPYVFIGGSGNGSLTVSAGGQVTAGAQTYVAEGTGGNGVGNLLVTGAGSSYAANGGLYVAADVNAQGTVTIEDGASLTANNILMGAIVPGGNATLNVTGAATTVNAGTTLAVGDYGTGTVNLSNGATVTANTFTTAGARNTGNGTINIHSGATLNSGITTIGGLSTGELNIDTGGHMAGTTVTIGENITGTAVVTGIGSTLSSTASTVVGANAAGALTIEDGAVVTSRRGRLGSQSAGVGTVTVTGAGSVWNVTHATDGDLLVGENGDGVLNIENGGVVNSRSLIAAGVLGTTGDITVTGAGSELNVDTVLRFGIDDTLRGTGSLKILDGGAVTVGGGAIGDYLTASNSTSILVDGAGSSLTITQGIVIGNSSTPSYLRLGKGGTNSLTVSDGGSVSLDRSEFIATAASSVAVLVTGADTTWTSNTFEVGGAGTAGFTITDGASVEVQGDSFNTAIVNGTGATTPTLTISDGGQLTVAEDLRVGTTAKGTLSVESGGQLTTGTLDFAGNTGSTGTGTFTDSGTIVDAQLLQLGLGGTGTLTVTDGAALTTGTTSVGDNFGGSGTMTVTGSATSWNTELSTFVGDNGSLTIEDGASMTGGAIASLQVDGVATVTGTGTTVSSMNLWAGNNSSATSAAEVNILSGATFGGTSGYIGAQNEGVVTVDGAGSQLNMSGTLRVGISATGTLDITNSGAVSSLNGYVGTQSSSCGCGISGGGAGTVNITGTGASWTVTQAAIIGDVREGTLNVTGGASMSSGSAIVGNGADGDGTATVTGAGSSWTNAGAFIIGADGEGALTVAAGGTVTSTGAATIGAGGRLNIGSGGVAGTFSAPTIANNGLVRFNHTGTVTFATVMSGTGGVTKDAAGTTILTGNNTITGTTRINAGELHLGNGGTGGAVGGDIVNNALLVVDRSNAVTLVGNISGSGALQQNGAGTTILTGTNTYGGGTTISAGTLQLGNGGATGSLAGNVANNSALAFNRSNTLVFGGTISGTGSLRQAGTGTTVLTAANNYGGGTTIAAGTLQLGNGGATGSIIGDVTDNGTLAFNRSNTLTFAGMISGSGGVRQAGTGRTILTADNSYGGGTTIAAGTLQLGNGGTTGSIAGSVVDNGTLVFNRSDVVTFAGAISGTGAVRQDGSGTTILTANNSYTGTTTINAGTLRLGNGGTTGSIAGDIVDNALLVLNRSNAITVRGDISGTGALEQAGTGTAILTGTNSHTGGTTISSGTLQLGNGGTTGSLAGNVANDGTLAFNRSNKLTFGGIISGSGDVLQDGPGTTVLTGTSTYTGTTTVNAGTLIVNGSIAASRLTVMPDGTLGGNGTVGPATIEGIVAPGNSIGILTVAGDYTQAADSLYLVEIDDSPAADRIDVTGAATLEAGARVEVAAAPGSYATGHRYTILTAPAGVTGTYEADFTAPFLDLALIYDPDAVYLDVVRSQVAFSQIAQTPNQKAAARGLESLDPASPLPAAIVPLSAPDARKAFDQLSGEAHAAMARVLIEDSRMPREAALDRVDAAFAAIEAGKRGGDADFWLRSLGNVGVIRADGNAAEIVHGSGGLLAGADIMLSDTFLFGVEAGLTGHRASVADRNSSASATGVHAGVHAGVYGGVRADALRVDFGGAVSGYGVRVERDPAFAGFTDSVAADYAALTVQGFGEIGYAIELGDAAELEPFLRVAIVGHGSSRYAETGGPSAVSGAVNRNLSVVATLGLAGSTDIVLGDGLVVEARGRIGWEQGLGGGPTATHAFAGGDPFTVSAQRQGGSVVAEGSVGIALDDSTRLDAGIRGQLSGTGLRGAATLTLSGRF